MMTKSFPDNLQYITNRFSEYFFLKILAYSLFFSGAEFYAILCIEFLSWSLIEANEYNVRRISLVKRIIGCKLKLLL